MKSSAADHGGDGGGGGGGCGGGGDGDGDGVGDGDGDGDMAMILMVIWLYDSMVIVIILFINSVLVLHQSVNTTRLMRCIGPVSLYKRCVSISSKGPPRLVLYKQK